MKLKRMIQRTAWLSSAAALAVLSETNALQAQTWQTVLDYQLAAGKAATDAGIAADTAGHVLTAGDAEDASSVNQGVALTTDTTQLAIGNLSATWNLSDDSLFDNPDINPSQYTSDIYDCGYDSSGALYSVGQLWPGSTGQALWYVRKSSNGGQSWSTLYEPDGSLYQYTPGQWAWPTGFAADGSGNIYVVGAARSVTVVGSGKKATTQTVEHRLVRRSSDGGLHWTLVDDLSNTPAASAAAVVPGIGIFVVGQYFYPGPWLVRKSVTGDAGTWTTVDGPIANANARGVCSDGLGNVYVAGQQFIATGSSKGQVTGYNAWVTRMSRDGGSTWSTVDTFVISPPVQNQNTPGAYAHRAATDSSGNVIVAGLASDGTAGHWIVRRRDSSTGLWTTLDDFQLAPGYGAQAMGVVTDATGHILVSGNANDSAGSHWIVRRF